MRRVSAQFLALCSFVGALSLAVGCAGVRPSGDCVAVDPPRRPATTVAGDSGLHVAVAATEVPDTCEIVPTAWVRESTRSAADDAEERDTVGDPVDEVDTRPPNLLPPPLEADTDDQAVVDDRTPHSVAGTSGGLTLDELVSTALANNPAVAEARAAASEAAGVRTQVGLRPNPTIAYVAEEIGADGAGGLHNVNLSQTFVRGQKLEWNRAVVDRDVQRLLWQADAQATRVRTDVAVRFYDALAAQRRVELADAFLNVADRGVDVAGQRLDAGEGTRADVLQAENLRNEVRLLERQAHIAEEAARRRLAALTGADVTDVRLAGVLSSSEAQPTFESLLATLVEGSPVVLAAQAEVQRARHLINRHSVQAIPNVTGQLGVGQDFASDNTFANVGVSLPIPVHNRNQGNIARARADYCRAVRKVERLRGDLADRLAVAMRDYQQANTTASLYADEILPKAEEARELAEEAYLAGEFDFLRVLTARRAAFDANLNYLSSLVKAAQQRALLDGFLLSGSFANATDYEGDDGLRDLSLSGQ